MNDNVILYHCFDNEKVIKLMLVGAKNLEMKLSKPNHKINCMCKSNAPKIDFRDEPFSYQIKYKHA